MEFHCVEEFLDVSLGYKPLQEGNKFGQLIDASFRPIFSTKFENRQTDQQTYLPVEMQFYISMMFLGLPDDIHEAKPLFLQFKKKMRYRRTDGRTDGRTRPSL